MKLRKMIPEEPGDPTVSTYAGTAMRIFEVLTKVHETFKTYLEVWAILDDGTPVRFPSFSKMLNDPENKRGGELGKIEAAFREQDAEGRERDPCDCVLVWQQSSKDPTKRWLRGEDPGDIQQARLNKLGKIHLIYAAAVAESGGSTTPEYLATLTAKTKEAVFVPSGAVEQKAGEGS